MYNPFTLVGYSGHTFDAMIMLRSGGTVDMPGP